ncbi:hypothetical protein B0T22DRAFT_441660 [Podospora appendiculata]|uniref:Uncharacterized protein n=1 Tax=Podospora appendiculata TaxID=314037 RepID=A0AAE0XD46_9PEZI|nr:hypothetical protein B0T22DRAFT_441660 [Podospora appendiculata]
MAPRLAFGLQRLVLSHRAKPKPKPQIETQAWTRQPSPRDPPPWKEAVTSFFQKLAKTEEEWQKKREEANLSSADDILRVADALLLRSQKPCFEDHLSEPVPDAALEEFGLNAGRVLADYSTIRIASPFLSLIFLAACEVALSSGVEKPRVRAIQREVPHRISWEKSGVGRDGSLTRRSVYSNADFGIALSSYFSSHKGAHDEFADMVPSLEVPTEIQASMPFWISFFVHEHFSRHWSYTGICNALGVEIFKEESDWRRFHESYTSRELIPCRLEITTSSDQHTSQTVERMRRSAVGLAGNLLDLKSKARRSSSHSQHRGERSER